MSRKEIAATVALGCLALNNYAFADFIGDSKATLGLRNFYFSNDNRDGTAAPSKTEEWAQAARNQDQNRVFVSYSIPLL